MKAVIPVAGAGTKLRPHTHTQPKALVPVAGKPLLAHIVDFLIRGGIREFIFIIGHMGSKIQQFIQSHYSDRPIKTYFVMQEPREGSAHAIWMARAYIQPEESFLIMFGDTIIDADLTAFIHSPETCIGIRKVKKPTEFGIAVLSKQGRVEQLVEKPRIPKSNYGLVGLYKIREAGPLFATIDELVRQGSKTQGEFHLTDALMKLLENGEEIRAKEVESWYDCGKKQTLLEANSILLNRPGFPVSRNSHPDTIIIQPVRIGENCDINRSIIGPNVVIGDNTNIESSVLSNSIIGSYSQIQGIILHDSIMGNDTQLKGMSQSLNIGDNTEITLG